MIALRIIGGLGNQLFQYCTGRAIAARLNTELVLDTSWYDGPFRVDTHRIFGLRSFEIIKARFPTRKERAWLPLYNNRLLARLPFPRPWQHIKQAHFHYDPQVLSVPDDSYLSGYWQSEQYFSAIKDTLLVELNPSGDEPPGWHDHIQSVTGVESVSMHLRRGDYVSRKITSAFHGALPLSYYLHSVEYLSTRVKDPVIFVFSDDLVWAQQELQLPFRTQFVSLASEDPVWEMKLMSTCRHNIIANSSFSWWGAWLNTSTDRIVIAPKCWFQDPGINTSDLIPTDWHRI